MSPKAKIMVVMGTRPEVIKLAPVIFELQRREKFFRTDLVWSGQHLELARPFLKLFRLNPKYPLEIMQTNQTSVDIVRATLEKLSPLFQKRCPDWVLVQGDTTTALAASLCAYYHQIPLIHLEAGLRSFDPLQPFPEEKNRELIDHLASLHFAPTRQAANNLLREGIKKSSIHVVGNSVVDALQWLLKNHPPPARLHLIRFQPDREKLLVVTAHRRESFGTPLENICEALATLSRRHKELQIVFPVHLNPVVRKTVLKRLEGIRRIHLLPPLDYLSFVHLLTHCTAILSDSGGLQEEAPVLGKPLLILRDVTERPEGLLAGTNRLVGREPKRIVEGVEKLLYNPREFRKRSHVCYPFGRGNTAVKVADVLTATIFQ